jgi:hypothetical protein
METYSHLNGAEFIQVHRPALWREAISIIRDVDAETCRTKVSREKTKKNKLLYSPIDLNIAYKRRFQAHGWTESRTTYYVTAKPALVHKTLRMPPEEQKAVIESAGSEALFSYNQTDFVKNRIAVEVQFGKYAFVAYDLFVKHMAFYMANQIDVGIEILPMKAMQNNMSSGISYYEGELYNILRQGRGVPAVPLVLIGVAP